MRIKLLDNKIWEVSEVSFNNNLIYMRNDTNNLYTSIYITDTSKVNEIFDKLLVKGYCNLSDYV